MFYISNTGRQQLGCTDIIVGADAGANRIFAKYPQNRISLLTLERTMKYNESVILQ
jgi:hypothetical protein